MLKLTRYKDNPILSPVEQNQWEHDGAFNGCVAKKDNTYYMVYRALSSAMDYQGQPMKVSSIGLSESSDGFNFGPHKQWIKPEHDWEKYGCEDPRITYLDGEFYIFYTALSTFPFAPQGIKIGLAITRDFKTYKKYPVTTFNSKAMALFPEKINGKYAALLTPHTDLPPSKIGLALFDKQEDIWSSDYWNSWHDNLNSNVLPLLRENGDQVELGSPPVRTQAGWLVIYSYIKNYMTENKIFTVEAVLLDGSNPDKIIGRTDHSLLIPEMHYELHGEVPNIVFPSGALIEKDTLNVYYGAADTRTCIASCSVSELLKEIAPAKKSFSINFDNSGFELVRFEDNPIISPAPELAWQSAGVFNPAAIYDSGKVHILYRAQSADLTSTFGYASSIDGIKIDENLPYPVYIPREDFEKKPHEFGNSGCEDPRLTKIGDRFYVLYTAYNGVTNPRIAMSSISADDFLNRNWNWTKPKLISLEGFDDKDACVVQGKKPGTYLWFHRLGDSIWLEISDTIELGENNFLTGTVIAYPRKNKWDNLKIGLAGPPNETDEGWLMIYHGVSNPGSVYRVGAMLLDYQDPTKIIARIDEPIFEPVMKYELEGQVPNVVFPCGHVIIDDVLYAYYGGADKVLGVAGVPVKNLMKKLLRR